MIYLFFIAGFFLLVKGAKWLVAGASLIARWLGISELVIGLTIVSMGTSMPELTVNLLASFKGNADIAIGNVLGSNIANVLLILGATAAISALPVKRSTLINEIPFSLAAALLIGFVANAAIGGNGIKQLEINRIEGGIILFFFLLFLAYTYDLSKQTTLDEEAPVRDPSESWWKAASGIIGGAIGLFLGGKWVVDGAIHIATLIGMSEAFIGLTVVAIGTSLPELVTSVVAARHNNVDIAIGNVVGSNIFNMLFILGVSASVRALPFHDVSNTDLMVVVFSSTLLIIALITTRKMHITRLHGFAFVALYVIYLSYLVSRG